jgi:hypothetical protein
VADPTPGPALRSSYPRPCMMPTAAASALLRAWVATNTIQLNDAWLSSSGTSSVIFSRDGDWRTGQYGCEGRPQRQRVYGALKLCFKSRTSRDGWYAPPQCAVKPQPQPFVCCQAIDSGLEPCPFHDLPVLLSAARASACSQDRTHTSRDLAAHTDTIALRNLSSRRWDIIMCTSI